MIRNTLTNQDFTEVQTPILSSSAGGAIAKPFLTTASSTSRTLALRIAPELWLKRLLVGGLDRVFELGPQFRNEGIDNTHNPEFTTCEAYISYGRLADVIRLTENLFRDVARMVAQLKEPLGMCHALSPLDADIAEALNHPFKQLEFIPTLEAELGEPLPDLEGKHAGEELRALCERHKVPVESNTPAKILDKLAQHFLEPLCHVPTFITHHPACMSPLAKSRVRRGRVVSERVELFVQEQELVNAYEEENSPREQRRKFKLQLANEQSERPASTEDTPTEEGGLEEGINESYCSTLEWGMPPTAGWGLGVDRMVMLFSGQDRIADVMAFGGLRGAVNQGIEKPVKKEEEQTAVEQSKAKDEGKKKQKKQKEKEQEKWNRGAEVDVRELNELVGELAESLSEKLAGLGQEGEAAASEEKESVNGPPPIHEEIEEVAKLLEEMAREEVVVKEPEDTQEAPTEKSMEEIAKLVDSAVWREGEAVNESEGNQEAPAEEGLEKTAEVPGETVETPKAVNEEEILAQPMEAVETPASPPAPTEEQPKAKEETTSSIPQEAPLSLPLEVVEAGVDVVAETLGEVAEAVEGLVQEVGKD